MVDAHFSGHETFQCKSLWLKKGYDFVKAGESFSSDDAVIQLGVGKNMVSSIKFWLKAFGLIDDNNKTTSIADYIFGENGADPFLEDTNTLWLLHYLLVSTNYATLYNQVFLNMQKERNVFSKADVVLYIRRKYEDKQFKGSVFNENTLNKDIATLLKMYVSPQNQSIEDFSSIFVALNLITQSEDKYEFNVKTKEKVCPLMFLYAIKSVAGEDKTVEFGKLLMLMLLFGMSQSEMYDMFELITKHYPNITFSNSAGEQLFAINEDISAEQILDRYYGRQS